MAGQGIVVEEVHAPNGGLVDTVQLDLLQGSEASEMVNMHHDRLGLDRREGFVQIGKPTPDLVCYGGFHYRRSEGLWQILRVQGGHLFRGTGADWVSAVSGIVGAGVQDVIGNESGPGSWLQYANKAYWHDSNSSHYYWNGSQIVQYGTLIGVVLPKGTITASTIINGQLQKGVYRFIYTYFNPATAEETDPSEPSDPVTLSAAGGTFDATVATRPTGWTAGFSVIRFYRTSVNGGEYDFDHQVDLVGAALITTRMDKPDIELGTEARFDHGPIPKVRYAIVFGEMVVAAGNPDSPSTIYWSEVGDPTHWPPRNAQDIDRDNGDPITGIFRLMGRLFVLKQTSGVYMLTPQITAAGAVYFQVDAITNDWGCLSHFAIVVIDTYAYWPDAKGICRFNGQQCVNVSDAKIRALWRRVMSWPPPEADDPSTFGPTTSTMVAVHDRQADHQYYRLTVGLRYAIDLIFDVSLGIWFIDKGEPPPAGDVFRPGAFNVTSWLIKDTKGQYAVFHADIFGRAYRLRTDMNGRTVYSDAGQPMRSQWKSRSWGGYAGVVPLGLYVEYERSRSGFTSGPVTVNFYRDGQSNPSWSDSTSIILYDLTSPAPPTPDSTLPDPTRQTHTVYIPFPAEWCRRFQFEFVVDQTNADLRINQFGPVYRQLGPMLKAV